MMQVITNMIKTIVLFLLFFIGTVLAGCKDELPRVTGGTEAMQPVDRTMAESSESGSYLPAYGDALIVGSIAEPSVLIPMLAGDSASHAVAGLVLNGLVKYHTDLSVIGDLAESWDISDDGLVITFHLKKGVRWTDGVEFTAVDVMFGYTTIIEEKTPTPYKEDYLQVI
jgi:peptide/nickel transport system substrate-binding protein